MPFLMVLCYVIDILLEQSGSHQYIQGPDDAAKSSERGVPCAAGYQILYKGRSLYFIKVSLLSAM